MTCICHPRPYHKPECPCQVYYVQLLQSDPTTEPEAMVEAEHLWNEGYRQTSRRFRMVSKTPGVGNDYLELSIKVFKAFKIVESLRWKDV